MVAFEESRHSELFARAGQPYVQYSRHPLYHIRMIPPSDTVILQVWPWVLESALQRFRCLDLLVSSPDLITITAI